MKLWQMLWEFPQTLLGWIVFRLLKIENKSDFKGRLLCFFKREGRVSNFLSGVSLGFYILLPVSSNSEETIMHEYGHCLQSRKWGWLYLFVIGIPSLFNNLRGRIVYKGWTRGRARKDYYSRWPEKEADFLGGVVREGKNYG